MGVKVRDGVAPKLRRIRRATSPVIGRALDKIGWDMTRQVDKNLAGRVLHERSGTLRASWMSPGPEVTKLIGGWRMAMGSDVIYSRIQDQGGWTGRGHRTHIKPSRYFSRVLLEYRKKISDKFKGMMIEIRNAW